MRTHIANLLENCEVAENVKEREYDDDDDITTVFFSFITDESDNSLKRYQPENSCIMVKNTNIIDYDIRLGKWQTDSVDRAMSLITKDIREVEQKHCIFGNRIDKGEGAGFVPHIRMRRCEIHPDVFINFIEDLGREVDFCVQHRIN
jgi:hypothetical protein